MSRREPDGRGELVYEPGQDNVVLRSFLEAAGAPAAVDCGVHRADEMFAYALTACQNSWNEALVMYHQGGALGWRIVDQLLEGIESPSSWLDFGCGYGRVLRFGRAARPGLEIVGCEIDERAVRFVASRYGIRGLDSSSRPSDLELPQGIDLITAQSVFTHLPETAFVAWLLHLWEAVSPGGILAVSTNDMARMPSGVGQPDQGFAFERYSESDLLSEDDYGTTWVAAAWMERAAQRLGGERLADLVVVPRGLWNAQDLWVLRKASEGSKELPALDVRPAPIGYVEGVELLDSQRVKVEGWALARSERDPVLRIELVDTEQRTMVREEMSAYDAREDLRAEFGADLRGGAWSIELDAGRPLRGLEILRICVEGWPIHTSLLDAADRRVRTERRIQELEVGQRILKDELERKGGLPLRFARALLRRLSSK